MIQADPDRRIDPIVLVSLVPTDRWETGEEIGVQLGIRPQRVWSALAAQVAGGAPIEIDGDRRRTDGEGQRYRRRAETWTPTAIPPDEPVAVPPPVARVDVPEPPKPAPQHNVATPKPSVPRHPKATVPDISPFGVLLRQHRVRASLSQNQLARRSGIDPAYVNRLERAPVESAASPRRGVVLALANTLGLDDAEADRLLFAAGLSPALDYQALAEDYARRLEMVEQAVAGLTKLWPAEPAALERRRAG